MSIIFFPLTICAFLSVRPSELPKIGLGGKRRSCLLHVLENICTYGSQGLCSVSVLTGRIATLVPSNGSGLGYGWTGSMLRGTVCPKHLQVVVNFTRFLSCSCGVVWQDSSEPEVEVDVSTYHTLQVAFTSHPRYVLYHPPYQRCRMPKRESVTHVSLLY